jgi:hypothetical protein
MTIVTSSGTDHEKNIEFDLDGHPHRSHGLRGGTQQD